MLSSYSPYAHPVGFRAHAADWFGRGSNHLANTTWGVTNHAFNDFDTIGGHAFGDVASAGRHLVRDGASATSNILWGLTNIGNGGLRHLLSLPFRGAAHSVGDVMGVTGHAFGDTFRSVNHMGNTAWAATSHMAWDAYKFQNAALRGWDHAASWGGQALYTTVDASMAATGMLVHSFVAPTMNAAVVAPLTLAWGAAHTIDAARDAFEPVPAIPALTGPAVCTM